MPFQLLCPFSFIKLFSKFSHSNCWTTETNRPLPQRGGRVASVVENWKCEISLTIMVRVSFKNIAVCWSKSSSESLNVAAVFCAGVISPIQNYAWLCQSYKRMFFPNSFGWFSRHDGVGHQQRRHPHTRCLVPPLHTAAKAINCVPVHGPARRQQSLLCQLAQRRASHPMVADCGEKTSLGRSLGGRAARSCLHATLALRTPTPPVDPSRHIPRGG